MTTKAIALYNILVEHGVEKERAQEAVDAFLTRVEAEQVLASKTDLNRVIMWMAGLLVGQTATLTGILALFF